MMDTPRLRTESVPRSLAALVVAVLLLALVPFAGTALARPGEIEITDDDGLVPSYRFAGEDRFDTSELIATDETEARARFGGDAVILARADLFPDALAGSTLAGLEDAPIVLTPSTTVDDDGDLNEDTAEALDEYETRGLATVYLLGETNAIGDDVADAVEESYPDVEVVRIGGENRFETAALIADRSETSTVMTGESTTAIVARGDDFADALVAGSIAAAAELPLLLTGTEAPLDPFAEDRLESLGIERVLIAGGTAAISTEVEEEIEAIVGDGSTQRVAGPERTATAVEFAQLAAVEFAEVGEAEFGFDTDHANLAFGFNFPDALALGPHAGLDFNGPAPILLSASDELGDATADYFDRIGGCDFTALHVAGGTDAVPDSVEQEARRLLTGDQPCSTALALSLTPEAATNFIGETHTVTATVLDDDGDAVTAAGVDFGVAPADGDSTVSVSSETVTVTTGDDGTASFDFSSDTPGDVVITASVTDSTGTVTTDTATKTFVVPAEAGFLLVGDDGGNALVPITTAAPGDTGTPVPVTGVTGGTALVGLDYRNTNGLLYALGSDGQLYAMVVPADGATTVAATAIGAPITTVPDGGVADFTAGVAFDFNPVIDRIRVVTADGTNLVVNPDAESDGDPATGLIQAQQPDVFYADGDDNDGAVPAVTAAAYRNNVAGATFTELYVIDSDNDVLATQSATVPTAGSLATDGDLGLDVAATNGFDISGDLGGAAYAALTVGTDTSLYVVDLETGGLVSLGLVTPGVDVDGFTVVPEEGTAFAEDGFALGEASTLVPVSTVPGAPAGPPVGITALTGGTELVGLDYRASDGLLYALGDDGQLYSLPVPADTDVTVAATPIGAPITTDDNGDPLVLTAGVAFDFNPVIDRIRVVTADGTNLVVNPDDEADLIQLQQDDVAYAVGDDNEGVDPAVTAAAYTNNVAGADSTELYVIDSGIDVLATQSATPPTAGELTTDGDLGVDAIEDNGFDISGVTGDAYAILNVGGADTLYRIDLNAGTAIAVGPAPATVTEGFTLVPQFDAAFDVALSFAQEVPPVTGTTATGTASLQINVDDGVVCYDIAVTKEADDGTFADGVGSHIHEAPVGAAGPIVVGLETLTDVSPTSGAAAGCQFADAAQLADIVAAPADYYVNVHTDVYPSGITRGQLPAA